MEASQETIVIISYSIIIAISLGYFLCAIFNLRLHTVATPTIRSRSYISRRTYSSTKEEVSSLSSILTLALIGFLVCTLLVSVAFIATQLPEAVEGLSLLVVLGSALVAVKPAR